MKNLIIFCSVILSVISVTSCSKEEEDAELKITMGVHCGWGLRQDSISLNSTNVILRQNYWVNNQTISLQNIKSISPAKVSSIENSINWPYFKSLNYNSGNLGSDGCDIWLRISKDGSSHEIRFSPDDTIRSLRPLTDQLDSLWSKMGSYPTDLLDNF